MSTRLRTVIRSLTPEGGVAERTVKSGVWVALTKYGNRALQFVMVVVLARLLDPGAFGLLGIALLTNGALKRFSRLGLEAAIIQRKERNVDRYLNTAWTLEIARGMSIFAVGVLSAPYVASFFNEPRATAIIQVICLGSVLHGLRNPSTVYFKKDLDFHKEAAYKLSGSVLNFAVAITIALVSASVWALVLGHIAGTFGRLVASYVLDGYRPRPAFNLAYGKELVNYGKWVTGSSILSYAYDTIDDAVVGRVLTATSLGFYQVAYQLANAPTTEITHVVSRVTFPAYSQLQDDMVAYERAYFATVRVVTAVSFPASIGIIVVAPAFVDVVLGSAWSPIVVVLQLLAVHGLRRSFTSTVGSVYKSLDRPDLVTKIASMKFVVIVAAIYPATVRYGIEGAALVIVGAGFLTLPINIYCTKRLIGFRYRRLARELAYPLVASGLMGLGVYAVTQYATIQPAIVELPVLVGTGILLYAVLAAVLEWRFGWGLEPTARFAFEQFA